MPEPDPAIPDRPHAGPDAPEGISGVRLEFLSGSRRQQVQDLPGPGTYTIGCDPAAAVTFDGTAEPFVSRAHAELHITDTQVALADLGSANGTYVNGQALTERRPLYNGDVMEFGTDGPRVRFDCIGNACARSLGQRQTVVVPRRSRSLAPDLEARPAGARQLVWIALAGAVCLLVVALHLLSSRQRQADTDQTAALAALRQDLETAQADWSAQPDLSTQGPRLVKAYGGGVYLLALRIARKGFQTGRDFIPVGRLEPAGTAWALDPKGLLVTNGHVALYLQKQYDRYREWVEMVAVQNGTGTIYPIQTLELHPDCTLGDMRQLTSDVALIQVQGALPVVCRPARRATAEALAAGEPVFSIGFPIEAFGGMQHLYGYDSPERVIATLRTGVIQRVTAADGRRAAAPAQRLVHVGIATVSGQSGSPVFNTRGEVVAILNATAVARFGEAKLPHPGLFTYSVRIDALWDMLETKRDDAEPAPGG